jgi:hypothetical protein
VTCLAKPSLGSFVLRGVTLPAAAKEGRHVNYRSAHFIFNFVQK